MVGSLLWWKLWVEDCKSTFSWLRDSLCLRRNILLNGCYREILLLLFYELRYVTILYTYTSVLLRFSPTDVLPWGNESNDLKRHQPLIACRLTIKASCPMHLENYPMDVQICPIRIASRESYDAQITFIASPDIVSTII